MDGAGVCGADYLADGAVGVLCSVGGDGVAVDCAGVVHEVVYSAGEPDAALGDVSDDAAPGDVIAT